MWRTVFEMRARVEQKVVRWDSRSIHVRIGRHGKCVEAVIMLIAKMKFLSSSGCNMTAAVKLRG